MPIRPVRQTDKESWERMREALWPAAPGEHAEEIDRYFAGALRELLEVLIAVDEHGTTEGFIELSMRAYAIGCATDRVAFVEGWYVEPAARGRGVGASLIAAAEIWARSQGCTELASDAEIENLSSAADHRALGFVETGVIRCFKKSL